MKFSFGLRPLFQQFDGLKEDIHPETGPKHAAILFLEALLLLALVLIPLTHKIDFSIADLGRHLKNGEVFIRQHLQVSTNFYSYTQPDYPCANHHWASGVIFYCLHQAIGFQGLHAFSIGMLVLSFFLMYHLARTKAGASISVLTAIMTLPLITLRREIRPEMFSTLFSAVFYFILISTRENRLQRRWLALVPLLEALWVNLHIYFFMGPLLVAAFMLETAVRKGVRGIELRRDASLLFWTLAATLLNPRGIAGALHPLMIWGNYEYPVAENQSILFALQAFPPPHYPLFILVYTLLILSFLLLAVRRREFLPIADCMLGITLGVMGCASIRNLSLFAFFALPMLAKNIAFSFPAATAKLARALGCAAAICLCFRLSMAVATERLTARIYPLGLGLQPGHDNAGNFLKNENIQGPIFNNYDIGGYLIYHLFPQARVFVDNRPEAYGPGFLNTVYVRMLGDEVKWKELDRRYRFNAIVLLLKNPGNLGKALFSRRYHDPEWAWVFVDQTAFILVRRTRTNADLIKKYEIKDIQIGFKRELIQ